MKRRLEGEVSPSQGRCRDGGLAFIYYNSFPGILIHLLLFWHNLLAHPICNTATEGNHILVIQQTPVTQKGPVDSGQPSGTRQPVPQEGGIKRHLRLSRARTRTTQKPVKLSGPAKLSAAHQPGQQDLKL